MFRRCRRGRCEWRARDDPPGNVIRVEACVGHWHGATPGNSTTHIAVTEGDTDWGEHLTDDE
jgi:hypothetical protein